MKRLAFAAVIIPLIWIYIMELSAGWYAGLLVASTTLAQYEFYSMYGLRGLIKYASIFFGGLIILSAHFTLSGSFPGGYIPEAIVVSFMAISSLRLFMVKDPSSALKDISPAVIGLLYIPLLLSLQMALRKQGPEWVIFLYGSIWAADSAAYFIGKKIGKRKLYESMSPKKTVAGAVASVIGGAVGALILWRPLHIPMPVATLVLSGFVIGAVAIVGDLVESMFKRDAGIKDSGGIFPGGHGGMLDKLDSSLFAGPALYWFMYATGFIRG